jgi:hypothetical protein
VEEQKMSNSNLSYLLDHEELEIFTQSVYTYNNSLLIVGFLCDSHNFFAKVSPTLTADSLSNTIKRKHEVFQTIEEGVRDTLASGNTHFSEYACFLYSPHPFLLS